MVRSILKIVIFILFSFILIFSLALLDKFINLGLTKDMYNSFVTPFLLMVYFIFVYTSFRKDFLIRFILTRELYKVICYPIFLSLFLVFVINASRFVPLYYGGEIIGVGSKQGTDFNELSTVGKFLLVSLFTGFTEEVAFRYLAFGGLFLFLNQLVAPLPHHHKSGSKPPFKVIEFLIELREKLFFKKNKYYLFSWLLLTSSIFAFAHGPDITNFHLYFLPGFAFGWCFIRYGFLAAWICHASFNALSWPALIIIYSLLL
ncbi:MULTISPECIES: type II CAAX prenyl endopeptidase Rce1 family protein [Bacillaceae]|uniref:CPBP family intramembrane metalloprotease n=1 Tax=Evansella alkalicola TaxID=745819 RepID=A0ABS6JYI2_9BACI|nr:MULTISPECIES: CPBP family glutamic-type intramembrane protease [Bacillaceae]MBU9723651.1 CPBP family intramembrane metalloprotease [Bacillus alkalicola]